MKKTLYLIIALLLCFVSLFGCNTGLSVYTDGGNLTTEPGNDDIIAILNSIPTKDGFIFGGWYADSDLTKPVNKDTEKLYQINSLYAKWITADTKSYDVRNDSATITDSGRKHQKCDTVLLNKDFDYEGLLFAGYTSFEIAFQFDVYEINDGYQYVFFYKDKNCVDTSSIDYFINNTILGNTPDDPSLLYGYRFEHTPGASDSSTYAHSFVAHIDIKNMKDSLYIRYGASGNGEDTWVNQNVKITVTPIK